MPYIENGQLDAARLVAMGYEPQLSRGIRNWVMSASLTVVAVGTVPFVGLDIILQAGGPATVLASWVITSVFTLITVCALAEICSAYPNSGATYHWTGQLAPRRWAPLASYIVGALLLVGNVAVTAVTAANEAQWIASMAAIRGTELSPSAITGIAVGCVTLWAAMNMMPVAILARLVVGFASWQAAVAVVIPAVLYSLSSPVPSSAAGLWNDWIDELGFANVNGYAAIIGSTGALVTLTGFDASAHLAEETLRAHWATPIGMIAAACFSIAAGLWLVVTYLLFVPASTLLSTSSSSSESTLSSGGYGLLITIIDNATSGSIVTIEAIAAAIAVSLFMSGYAIVAVTSRVAFAMARDDALPFSSYIRFLHSKRESPDIATLLVATAAVVILLFSLGDIRAYNWVAYPFFSCFQLTYAIPLLLRATVARNTFPRGAFHLGCLSVPAALVAALWCLPTGAFFMLPIQAPVTEENMNYSVVVLSGTAVLGAIWWFSWARLHFNGPRVRRGDLPPIGTRFHRNPRVAPLRPIAGRIAHAHVAGAAPSLTSNSNAAMLTSRTEVVGAPPLTSTSNAGLPFIASLPEVTGDASPELVQAAAAAAGVHIASEPGELIHSIFSEADAALSGPTASPLLVLTTPR